VTYPVAKPRPIDRAEPLTTPLVVAGNGSGLVNASAVGLLAGNPTIFYSGTLDTDRPLQKKVLSGHPDLVVTDTNRKQGYRWNGIADNTG
jgi:arabinofuranan 3-O-arabinosyltransferase